MSNTVKIGNQRISYEQAKKMLFPELIPQKGNEDILSNHPHDKVEDLAVVYRLELPSSDTTMKSARVTLELLDAFGVSAEQMKQDAQENAPKIHPPTFHPLDEVLSEMMGGLPVPTPGEGQPKLYVASTEAINRGAGVIAYPNFLQEAWKIIGGNYFILPSSIHELLFLKDTSDITKQELTDIVRSVNATEVSPQEQLSDNVYHYDGKEKLFELAEKYEARIGRQAKKSGEGDLSWQIT